MFVSTRLLIFLTENLNTRESDFVYREPKKSKYFFTKNLNLKKKIFFWQGWWGGGGRGEGA